MIRISIKDHLLIPFGSPKWSIKDIQIAGVSTDATYFTSSTPCVYIDKTKKEPLRLYSFPDVIPQQTVEGIEDSLEALNFIKNYLQDKCESQTASEKKFLDLYFNYCIKKTTPTEGEINHYKDNLPIHKKEVDSIFTALMPLPQAHLYLVNPLEDGFSFVPKNMVKVDFAFWTGSIIVAVEIDGSSHVGSEKHIEKDRMLQRAGVSVIHILNSELLKHGDKVISKLMPKAITDFWEGCDFFYNPMCVPF